MQSHTCVTTCFVQNTNVALPASLVVLVLGDSLVDKPPCQQRAAVFERRCAYLFNIAQGGRSTTEHVSGLQAELCTDSETPHAS